MAKNLIIYYSRKGENYFGGSIRSIAKGNTEIVAEYIQKAVGGDLFEVDTVKPYAANYNDCIEQAKIELRSQARPELKKYLTDITSYDHVFVCGPCWWGTFPMAIFSQLEKLDFTGKKVMAVMTHEGSGEAKSRSDLKKFCTHAKVEKAFAIQGSAVPRSEEKVAAWAKKHLG